MHPRRIQPAVSVLIAVLVASSAAVLGLTSDSASAPLRNNWVGVFALLAATVALQFRSFDIAGKGSIGVSAIAMATGAIMVGTDVTMAVAIVAAVVQWRRRRGLGHRALFDASNFALATAAAGITFDVLGGEAASLAVEFLTATLAGFAFCALNNALLCLVMSLDERRSARKIWDERFRWAVPSFAAFGPIVGFAAVAYEVAAILGVALVLGLSLLLSVEMKARVRRVRLILSSQSDLRLGRA
jgi:hypothetical protein